jgi:hypothetical protein
MWSARPLTAEKYASPCGNGEKSNKPILEKKPILAKIVEWINAFCSMAHKTTAFTTSAGPSRRQRYFAKAERNDGAVSIVSAFWTDV